MYQMTEQDAMLLQRGDIIWDEYNGRVEVLDNVLGDIHILLPRGHAFGRIFKTINVIVNNYSIYKKEITFNEQKSNTLHINDESENQKHYPGAPLAMPRIPSFNI